MNIKTRILLFVICIQLIGYTIILLINKHQSADDLLSVRSEYISSVFSENLHRINSFTRIMERNVTDIASAGEQFYAIQKQLSDNVKQMNAHQNDITQSQTQNKEATEQSDRHPQGLIVDAIKGYLLRNFNNFPQSIGGGLWYEPFTFDPKHQYFGPYAFWQRGQVVFSWELNTPSYDYHNQDWYRLAISKSGTVTENNTKVYWTQPYYDEAGSEALMMTVDAIMYDHQQQVIGLATVDWAMTKMTEFVKNVKVTPNAYSALIEQSSKKFVTNTLHPQTVMTSAEQYEWGKMALESASNGDMQIHPNLLIQDERHIMYSITTDIGLIFAVLIPLSDLAREAQQTAQTNFMVGLFISLVITALVALGLHYLFAPLKNTLQLIKKSISADHDGEKILVKPIHYHQNNEFTPIIDALNNIYKSINSFTQKIAEKNQALREQRAEVQFLNSTLEKNVSLRTEALETKTQEALDSLEKLQQAQSQMVELEKHASLGQLVAGVAHEINTPLGITVTATSHLAQEVKKIDKSLKDGSLTKSMFERFTHSVEDTTEIISNNLYRASDLIESFKQVSVDQSSESRRSFDLKHYLHDIVNSLRPKFKHTKHTIIIDCPEDIIMESYPGAVSQIITNLIINSLLHGFEEIKEGRINIKVILVEQEFIRIIYTDDGQGMPPENKTKIFEPFYTTKRGRGGSGLGMHIVYNIITQKLKGNILLETEPGKGVKFTLFLPLDSTQSDDNS